MMHDELVEKKRWISERRFLHALNYCMLLPGPEAQQLATYLGWLMHRTWGGILAGTLFILPSLLILIALSWIYLEFGQTPLIAALFEGIKPAVTAIVIVAVIRIAKRSIRHAILAWLAFLSFIAIFVFNVPFPLIIFSAGLFGLFPFLFAFFIPLINGVIFAYISSMITSDVSNRFVIAILAASASYIAVPAAMKISVPQANPGLFLPMALAVTFPVNITIGMPLYFFMVQHT